MRTTTRGFLVSGVAGLLALAVPSAFAGKPGGGGGTTPDPRIACARPNSRTGLQDLMVMNADGTNQRVVVAGAGNMVAPDWSPDGTELVYTAGTALTGYTICRVRVDGASAPQVLTTVGNGAFPRWSPTPAPDGQWKIVFADAGVGSASGPRRDVWLINTNGSGRVNLTQSSDLTEGYPTWSPDAAAIAVTTQWNDPASREGIDVLSLSSGSGGVTLAGRTTLTGVGGSALTHDDHYAFLSWSRTSGEIAASVIRSTETTFNTWVVDAEAPGAARRVTSSTSVQDASPSWSPDDGLFVLRISGSGRGSQGLATVSSAGGVPVPMGVDGLNPAWRR